MRIQYGITQKMVNRHHRLAKPSVHYQHRPAFLLQLFVQLLLQRSWGIRYFDVHVSSLLCVSSAACRLYVAVLFPGFSRSYWSFQVCVADTLVFGDIRIARAT